MTTEDARGIDEAEEDPSPGPLGRDAVVEAVLIHAIDLFAEKGPAATSIRMIADRAGVNHGLVFRHLGAKDELVTAVLNRLSAEASAPAPGGEFDALDDRQMRRHWMVLARCILDGYPVGDMQNDFPVIGRIGAVARRHHETEEETAMATANVVALQLGWQLFEPFLRSATGVGDAPYEQIRESVDAQSRRMLTGG